ncbi:hypothetical protein BIW11_03132 [Tropilaelaps mercedesae]|uniref:Uncharacterized protein n=1 Tax=Tropilaelaps mercedesae TaxID=418985 RepID=A0A1V9XRP7_9ACAR|nr:hypothetical protein BIW11_03132 [Tropilaelaps mercedesae]
MSKGLATVPSAESNSSKTQSDGDSPHLIPILGRFDGLIPVPTPPPIEDIRTPRRSSARLIISPRTTRTSPHRLEDCGKHHRGGTKPGSFPARGRFFPAVQFADVPDVPTQCRWVFPPTTLTAFGLDWLKNSKENSPEDIFAAREGTARIARALYRGDVIPGWSLGRADCQITWGGQIKPHLVHSKSGEPMMAKTCF